MFSQGDEERIIIDHFDGAAIGRFLDVGAWSGMTFSNVRMLAEMGWTGVMVEPAAHSFDELLRNYARFEGIDFVNAAVSPSGGLKPFWQSNEAVSSFDLVHLTRWEAEGVHFKKTWVRAITPDELIDAVPGPYDFVSVDAEGATMSIMRAMPLGRIGARLWCVEVVAESAELDAIMGAAGYMHIAATPNNVLYGK